MWSFGTLQVLLCYGLRSRLQAALPHAMPVDVAAAVGAVPGDREPLLMHATSAAMAALEPAIRKMLCALDVRPARYLHCPAWLFIFSIAWTA